MNGYLFDTCLVRTWYAKRPSAEAFVRSIPPETPLYISVVTLGEIEFAHSGVGANDPATQADFLRWMHQTFAVPQLSITPATAAEYAILRRSCFAKVTPKGKYLECMEDKLGEKLGIDENDLWILAQARERDLTVATHDKMNPLAKVATATVSIELVPQD